MCFRCGLPMLVAQSPEAAEPLCPDCGEGEMSFDRARSFGLYRDSLRAAILLLKFQRRERWGIRLGSLLAPACRMLLSSAERREALLVPVPLHASRLRQRGYNQADLLSRGLLRALSRAPIGAALKAGSGLLKRVRATPPQTGLSPAARRENVRGVFAVRSPQRARGRLIILVDDVMTTGATLSSCAGELRRAGAREVWGLTLARATPQFPDGGVGHGLAGVDGFAPQRP